MRIKRILLDNALESWSVAVKYCKDIQKGLATLHYQKTFISSLHNAIELLLKQIMLDNNDYSVISDVTVKSADEAKIQLEFYQSKNLNEFFLNLSDEQRKMFHSIKFSQLISRKNSLLKLYFDDIDVATRDVKKGELAEALTLINSLRNSETHFYISKIDYLSEDDFVTLHNLMIDFYDIMKKYTLLPFWGEAWDEYKHLEFKAQKMKIFSFLEALRSSSIAKSVKEVLSQRRLFVYGDSSYDLAEQYFDELAEGNKQSPYTFNEILSIIKMMNQYNLISFTYTEDEHISLEPSSENTSDIEKDLLTVMVHVRIISFGF